jgi:hypothetical protein
MVMLAKQCRYELDEETIAIYDQALSERHSYEELSSALVDIVKGRRARDPFPSIADIMALLDPAVQDKDLAVHLAGQIIRAVGKKGHTWPQCCGGDFRTAVTDALGAYAWDTIEAAGGWLALCESMLVDDLHVHRAQLRDAAVSVIARSKANKKLAALPHVSVQGQLDDQTAGDVAKAAVKAMKDMPE